MLLAIRFLTLALVATITSRADSSSESSSSEEEKFLVKNAADAFDLVFSAVNPDEQCKLAFQNCVLNENNNGALDMTLKCDVITKSIACLEKASFSNSECDYARAELKISRYRSFLRDLSTRCDEESIMNAVSSESPRLKLSSSNKSSPSPSFSCLLSITLLLVYLASFLINSFV